MKGVDYNVLAAHIRSALPDKRPSDVKAAIEYTRNKKRLKIKKKKTYLADGFIIDSDIMVETLCSMILEAAKRGHTLKMFLLDFNIRASNFNKVFKKYKAVRVACEDAQEFLKAYGQNQLSDFARNKKNHSPVMARLLMDNFYDIRELRNGTGEPEVDEAKLIRKGYKVITTTVKEEIPEEAKPLED